VTKKREDRVVGKARRSAKTNQRERFSNYQVKVRLTSMTGKSIGIVSYDMCARTEAHAIVKAGIKSAESFVEYNRELESCVLVS